MTPTSEALDALLHKLRTTSTKRTWDSVGRPYDYPEHIPHEAAAAIEALRSQVEALTDERDDAVRGCDQRDERPKGEFNLHYEAGFNLGVEQTTSRAQAAETALAEALEALDEIADCMDVDHIEFAGRRAVEIRARVTLAAAAPHIAAPDWRPIESDPPPKDGTPVILCIAGSEFHPRSAWWSPIFRNWVVRETNGPKGLQATVACSREFSFTHWRPLPAPPAAPQPPENAI